MLPRGGYQQSTRSAQPIKPGVEAILSRLRSSPPKWNLPSQSWIGGTPGGLIRLSNRIAFEGARSSTEVGGRNRGTGNRSARSRPLAPPQHRHGSRLPTIPRGEPQVDVSDTTPRSALGNPQRKPRPDCAVLSVAALPITPRGQARRRVRLSSRAKQPCAS